MSNSLRSISLQLNRLESRDVPTGTLIAIAEDGAASRVAVYTAPIDHLITPPSPGQPYFQRETKLLTTFSPYPGFGGGVHVAVGEVTGDAFDDVITAPGFGGGPHIKVYDGAQLQAGKAIVAKEFFAFDAAFRGGVFVAAGQMDPTSVQKEIVVGAGESGGPHVKVFTLDRVTFIQAPPNPQDYFQVRMQNEFFTFDASFRGGVRVAAGDVNGDGRDDLVAAAGPGGGPHVRVFDVFPPNPLELRTSNRQLLDEFFAYDAAFRGGVYVAAGHLTGDDKAEVVTGPGDGGGPHVKVFAPSASGKLALQDETFADYVDEGQGARVGIFSISAGPNVDTTNYPLRSIYVGFGSRASRVSIAIYPPGEYRIAAYSYMNGVPRATYLAIPFGLDGDERQGLFVGV